MTAPPPVRLVPFRPDLLDAVLPWFDHPEVQRRLGGRRWAARQLTLPVTPDAAEVRGQRVLSVRLRLARKPVRGSSVGGARVRV
ncbi:hypothetical protein [Modestobacter lapidis]|nr:hypothetical protein [Modestobacter lapidis]